jgi:nucleotide-binding universal stress UspA family protein
MQDILAYTDNFDNWSPGMEYAARLAAGFGAGLTGIYVCPPPTVAIAPYEMPDLMTDFMASTHQLEDLAENARSSFIDWTGRLGVRESGWQVAEGYVPKVLEYIGNWHDLLVLERAAEVAWGTAPALGNIVLTTRMPCIVVPPRMTGIRSFDCMALAWNGSAEAIRAIHAARPFMARARRVVVLRGERRDLFSEIGWRQEFDLSDYLHRHGIEAEERAFMPGEQAAGAALLEVAAELGADLLVMGAYGRARFSEWIFGGATRHVLANASVPVLMRH